MWFWIMAQAKDGADQDAIVAKRKQWVSQGKDQQVRKLCRTAQRYVIVGESPVQIFWLLDTDDPGVVQLMTDHFGDLWNLEARVVLPQHIPDAVGKKPA